jgi:cystathionine gamma-synthase
MAAVSTTLTLFNPGDHIIVSNDLYGGTFRLFEEIYKKYGIEFSYIDTSIINNIKTAIRPNTKACFIETPSNPMMRVTDLKAAGKLLASSRILMIVDNTFLTPYFQRPLDLGADIVIHSGTKYLEGHNDTLAGFIIVKDTSLAERFQLIQKSEGAMLSPFDSWLVLRGIKTLAIRLEKQQQNAFEVANWLRKNEKVDKVYYIGFSDHQGYEISKRQASGFGAMISFSVKDAALIEKILSGLKMILYAESLGGVESLITYPMLQTHAAIPEEIRNQLGVDDRLLRLSVGIEAVEDIIEDLKQALEV